MTSGQVWAAVVIGAGWTFGVLLVGMVLGRRMARVRVVFVAPAGAVVMPRPAPTTVYDQDADVTDLRIWADELRRRGEQP